MGVEQPKSSCNSLIQCAEVKEHHTCYSRCYCLAIRGLGTFWATAETCFSPRE